MAKEPSYATARKVRIIEERLGSGWQTNRPDESIDSVYNDLVGDKRKNLFCKIDPTIKDKLDEMTRYFDVKMATFIETLIDKEHDAFVAKKAQNVQALANKFSGQ